MEENCLFFCLSGDRFDGNTFAKEALDKGAKYVVIDNPAYKVNDSCICVPNTLQALQELAVYHRNSLTIPIIGITGTNGKTTTKELVSAVLAEKYKVASTKGNLNNHIGVPLTILSIQPGTDIAVVEMGANHIGEIAFLCEMAKPNYGIITNIGKAHLEGFGSIENIIETKTALYKSVNKQNGLLFVNADDELLIKHSKFHHLPHYCGLDSQSPANNAFNAEIPAAGMTGIFTYGEKGACKGICLDDDWLLKVHLPDYNIDIQTQLTGGYNFPNVMVAVAVGLYFHVSIEKVKLALTNYVPSNNRSQLIQKGNKIIIIDAYNANPSSMKLAIENIAKMNVENKILLLGNMSELGKESLTEHQRIVDLIRTFSFDYVYLFGDEFAKTNAETSWLYQNYEQLENVLKNELPNKAMILIKGSRSMKMERFFYSITN